MKDHSRSVASDAQKWIEITRRNARSVQTTVGWIFWDPGAVARFEALGLPGPLGYIASRCAPLAGAGAEAVVAAFGSISSVGIHMVFDMLDGPRNFERFWTARDEAIEEGLRLYAPDILEPLEQTGPELWKVVERLPVLGRVMFGSTLAMPRPRSPVLSGWHAINCLREWRGDTHWAIVVAAGLSHSEASILHNAWLGYEENWLSRSRGNSAEEIEEGWAALAGKGLATRRTVTPEGVALRQEIEDRTDQTTTLPWRFLGEGASRSFAERFEPPCELLLARVDETVGPNYQPASRPRVQGPRQ
jgi:hypothetical protein